MCNSQEIERLVEKSMEAFILGLEIYNKPTIRYRIEGFSFFICNAWELMLKAKLLKDGKAIYYAGKERTFSLSKVIDLVYTDKRQPLRVNLERIIELRNDSTHFITEDYEPIYAPLFQACVRNFSEQVRRFHGVDVTKYVAQNFLTISLGVDLLDEAEIRAKYSDEMANRLLKHKNEIELLTEMSSSADLYIPVRHLFYQTKDKREADFTYAIDSGSSEKVKILKQVIDPQKKYVLSANNVIDAVNRRLQAEGIEFHYTTVAGENRFNKYTLQMFAKFYGVKTDEKFCYQFEMLFRYTHQFVEFIVDVIRKDPYIIQHIKNETKKIAPGS